MASGAAGVVRPVFKTCVGVSNAVRTVSRTYVGVNNAVRTVNQSHVGVNSPITEIRIKLDGLYKITIDTSTGAITKTEATTLSKIITHAGVGINLNSMNRRELSIYAKSSGFGARVTGDVYAVVDGKEMKLKDALSKVELLSIDASVSAYGSSASWEGSSWNQFLGYLFHPSGYRDSFNETRTFIKSDITDSNVDVMNALKYGGYSYEILTFPTTAKVNGIDVPVTFSNNLPN